MPVFRRPEVPLELPYTVNEDRFWRFYFANPKVWLKFCDMVETIRAAGFKHYASKTIFEVMRHHHNIETRDPNGFPFKFSNTLTAYYPRLYMREFPDTPEKFFTFRPLTNPVMPFPNSGGSGYYPRRQPKRDDG
jgi:hypothetical protein